MLMCKSHVKSKRGALDLGAAARVRLGLVARGGVAASAYMLWEAPVG